MHDSFGSNKLQHCTKRGLFVCLMISKLVGKDPLFNGKIVFSDNIDLLTGKNTGYGVRLFLKFTRYHCILKMRCLVSFTVLIF